MNPGEQLDVIFHLVAGKNYGDLIAGLSGQVRDTNGAPALRIGLHAQSFASGQSAAFVNSTDPLTSVSAVPLPTAFVAARRHGTVQSGRTSQIPVG